MIREATEEDIPILVPLGEMFFKESAYKDISSFDEESFKNTLSYFVNSQDASLIVKEGAEGIYGMIAGMIYPFWFNKDHKTSQELFWYVVPEKRGGVAGAELFSAMEMTLKRKGADSISMVYLDMVNPDKVKRMYEKRGYRASEHTYIKRV